MTRKKSESPLRVEIVTVNPEIAKEWLKKNTGNRPVTASHVRFLASQMENDEWQPTGESIQFSESDRLIDGQHRLEAIVMSGRSYDILTVWGLPDASQAVIDTGKARSAGDTLSMNGIPNHTITAAMLKNFMRYKADITSYGGDKKLYHTNQKVLRTYSEEPDKYRETALYAQKVYKASGGLLPASVVGGFVLLFMDKSTGGKRGPVTQFFDKVLVGYGRDPESTAFVLYKKLLHARANKIRISQRELYGIIVKTWNSDIEGRYIQHLNMKEGEALPKVLIHPSAQGDLFEITAKEVEPAENMAEVGID